MHTPSYDDPVLAQEAPHLIAQRGALLDEQLAGAMQRLDVLVLYLFDRDKAHMRATRRLADGGGIVGIVLVALAVWRHELGTDQAHIMAQLSHRAGPVVRALTGFHTNTTG